MRILQSKDREGHLLEDAGAMTKICKQLLRWRLPKEGWMYREVLERARETEKERADAHRYTTLTGLEFAANDTQPDVEF
jgi:hypothetical protein